MSRPTTVAPLSAILLTSFARSSRDQGHRPYCCKLSSSIRTNTTVERCAGGGASRKKVSIRRNSESRTMGMIDKRTTRSRRSKDSPSREDQTVGSVFRSFAILSGVGATSFMDMTNAVECAAPGLRVTLAEFKGRDENHRNSGSRAHFVGCRRCGTAMDGSLQQFRALWCQRVMLKLGTLHAQHP